jgi:uncharacterized protein (UPF0335 family)
MTDTALHSLVERADRLWDRRGEINDAFGMLHKDVKDGGYDVETFRQIVREHRMEREVLEARLKKLAQYRAELGMLGALGEAAAEREADEAMNGHDRGTVTSTRRVRKPKPFAETPITRPRRGRRRKDAGQALAAARDHLGQLLSE